MENGVWVDHSHTMPHVTRSQRHETLWSTGACSQAHANPFIRFCLCEPSLSAVFMSLHRTQKSLWCTRVLLHPNSEKSLRPKYQKITPKYQLRMKGWPVDLKEDADFIVVTPTVQNNLTPCWQLEKLYTRTGALWENIVAIMFYITIMDIGSLG